MTILLVSLGLCLLMGIPIAYALGLSGFFYFALVHPELLSILPARLFAGMNSYAMIALPLFVFMGLLMNRAGITSRLIDFSLLLVGRVKGGLGLVNVIASMIFGGISGSSVADTASEGSIIIPQMVRKGYTPQFASGITVASSTMGMIIPPSVPMVIYSCVSGESVGKLFLGGLIPGVLIGCFMLGVTLFICLRGDYPREDLKLTWKQKTNMSLRAWPALIMPIFVVGSVVTGMATATESAALGVFYALVVGFFVMKELRLRDIPGLLRDAIMISATVMIIIAFSQLYVWILALERVPQALASLVTGLDLPVLVFSIVFALIVLVIGTFVDVSPAILLLTPVFLPAMKSIGISGIQFGVLLICGLAIGLITPPVGMCLNVCSAISGLQIGVIFRAALPFLLANLVTLALVALIPALSTWLPALLMD